MVHPIPGRFEKLLEASGAKVLLYSSSTLVLTDGFDSNKLKPGGIKMTNNKVMDGRLGTLLEGEPESVEIAPTDMSQRSALFAMVLLAVMCI